MRILPRLIPDGTHIPFMSLRHPALIISLILVLGSIALDFTKGLNFGIDFQGGILIEARTTEPADISAMRNEMGNLGLGEVALQEFGDPRDVLIRIERQAGDQAAQDAAVGIAKTQLTELYGDDIEFRRTEFVGPKVSEELFEAGIWAVVIAVGCVLLYIWFRFEWQFGIGAIAALVHDVALTIGMFSLLGLEFNLAIVAAILTIVGYSLNDTVVVFDRVRENLRKYKKQEITKIIDRSLNETLARTVMTSVTTLIALTALYVFGGEVIKGFTFAMIWGVLIGTYSSIFIASPVLIMFNLRAASVELPKPAQSDSA